MSEIIINKCYGGFSFSLAAVLALVQRNAKCVQRMTFVEYAGHSLDEHSWIGQRPEPIGDGYSAQPDWFIGSIYKGDEVFSIDKHAARTDPDALAIVREMGDAANGVRAKLRIIEIPDGVEWEIDEYDGIESVSEAHRSWG